MSRTPDNLIVVDVSKYIERADQEVKRRNYDHAVTLYLEILQIDPDCGDACAGFLRASLKKHERAYPSLIHRGVLNLPVRLCMPLAAMFRARGWTAGLCRSALKQDPRNPRLTHRLGHALLALGYPRSAEAAFQVACEFNPGDLDSLKILGQLAYDRKDLETALDCYERALKINPRDQLAAKMRKNLAAEGAIRKGGYETASSARELAKSRRQLREGEQAAKIVRTAKDVDAAIAEAVEQLEEKPDDLKLLLRLSDLHVQRRDYDQAVDVLLRARKLDPDANEISNRLGEARIRRFDVRIAAAEKAAEQGGEDAAQELERLRGEHLELQIEEIRRRLEIHPTDMGLRFRLGRCLLQDGAHEEAIEQLQQAVRDPKYRLGALHLMGRAFAAKEILDLAVKQLTEAADSIAGMTEQRKEILYDLAEVQERREKQDEALAIFKSIYESDISYRDVGERIEALGR